MQAPTTYRLPIDQLVDWIRLARTQGIGPATFRRLINQFGSASHAIECLPELATTGGRKKQFLPPSSQDIINEMERLQKLNGRFISLADSDYPKLLRQIDDPPPVISVIGTLNDEKPPIGIVGARNASAAGLRMTQTVAHDLGKFGASIISGLARGIDTAAHAASMEHHTVAVLAGGLDHIYPAKNIELAQAIVENGGAIVSEMPLGAEPRAKDFPRRNRIVSGLSRAVLVVEAAKRSGSLITARMALEQNRDVFAVPGFPLDPRAQGCNHLIQQGAKLVQSAEDIWDELHNSPIVQSSLFEENDDWSTFAHPETDMHGDESASQHDAGSRANADYTNPNDAEVAQIFELINFAPISVDEVVQIAQMNISKISHALLVLELNEQIERLPNGQIQRR